mmetsp:Transcript_9958/g.27882  ORF Transcript_9958/g.27882 Transcript_9958/m.27882 type:complete len:362 (-) Transcript_9958:1240-2325(-)
MSSSSVTLLAAVRRDYAKANEELAAVGPGSGDTGSKQPSCGTEASRLDVTSKLPSTLRDALVSNALERLNLNIRHRLLDDVDSSVHVPVTAMQDLLNQIIVDVKLSGLRQAREANLLDLLKKLQSAVGMSEAAQLKLLRNGRQAVGDVAVAAYRELECAKRKLEHASEALLERDAIIAKTKGAFEDMKQEVSDQETAHKALMEKLETGADDRVDAVSAKHQGEMKELQHILEERQKVSLEEEERLHGELRVAKSTIRKLEEKALIREKEMDACAMNQENVIDDLRTKLKLSEQAVGERDRTVQSLRRGAKEMRALLQDEADQLNAAEAKVKLILEKKEAKIASLLERAQAAEEELRSLARV